jgi:anti-sigma B factor antagonist
MARLDIFERQNGNLTILDLTGDITFGEGNIALRKVIRHALSEGKKHFLLNFGGVGYIDSSGIGELVSALIAINREGGQLRLTNLSSRAKELLTVCKLLRVFEVCENESETAGLFR